ncbi:MAG: secondary thiamine-phosphate synthase enzyme YjbQ [Bradymonadaceae bacterium]
MKTYRETIDTDLAAGLVPEESLEFDDLSSEVERIVAESGIREGTVSLFSEGATAAVTTIEYESGCLADLRRALDEIAPVDATYEHNKKWGDGNGFSHLRSALLDPSVTAPVVDGQPGFTTWQQPIVINLDNRERTRTVHVTATGE